MIPADAVGTVLYAYDEAGQLPGEYDTMHTLRAGVPIRHLQGMLGHASIKTAQVYTRVSIADLKAVHRRFHPRVHHSETDTTDG